MPLNKNVNTKIVEELEMIPIEKMTLKAIQSNQIQNLKIVETLQSVKIEPSPQNIQKVVENIQQLSPYVLPVVEIKPKTVQLISEDNQLLKTIEIKQPIKVQSIQPTIKPVEAKTIINNMATKKPNLFDNIWKAVKKPLLKGVEILGNAGGLIVGIPGLGTTASSLLDKIPVKVMAQKAAAAGVVDTQKVAQTLTANGIEATDNNINGAVQAIKAVAVADPNINIQKASQLPSNNTALSGFGKAIDSLKKNWYLPVAVVAVGVYFIFIRKKGRRF